MLGYLVCVMEFPLNAKTMFPHYKLWNSLMLVNFCSHLGQGPSRKSQLTHRYDLKLSSHLPPDGLLYSWKIKSFSSSVTLVTL